MPDKPLNGAERGVLAVLAQHHAKHGPVERTVLSVEVRGRGLEFGRALGRLITLGLAEEITRRPFFLWRLFGARSVVLLRPTAAGLDQAPAPLSDPAAPSDAATEVTVPEPVTAPEPLSTSEHVTAPEPFKSPEPITAPEPLSTPEPVTAPEPAAPHEPALPPEKAASPKPAAKAKAKARPRPITAFTEDLGGAPLPLVAPSLPPSVDPSTLDGLRETLSVLGLDLTPAGEALAANRIAKGSTPAEALSQVVLFAFAHAVQQDLYTGGLVADLGLRDYATEVLAQVAKLCTAKELAQASFDRDKAQLWAVLNDSPQREAHVKALLADPMGGAAPPAVLPEDLRHAPDE